VESSAEFNGSLIFFLISLHLLRPLCPFLSHKEIIYSLIPFFIWTKFAREVQGCKRCKLTIYARFDTWTNFTNCALVSRWRFSETFVHRDWITSVTFNPLGARATTLLGEVTRRGERPSSSLPIDETATNWIPCSVTRERGMYVGSRKLARLQAGWRDLRLAHVCVRAGGGSLCRRTARAIRQNLLPRSDRARTREAALVSREFPAYVTFTGISFSPSFFLSSFRRNVPSAFAFEGRDRFANGACLSDELLHFDRFEWVFR